MIEDLVIQARRSTKGQIGFSQDLKEETP